MRVKTFDKSMSLVCTHENQGVFHVILQTSYCSSYTKKNCIALFSIITELTEFLVVVVFFYYY